MTRSGAGNAEAGQSATFAVYLSKMTSKKCPQKREFKTRSGTSVRRDVSTSGTPLPLRKHESFRLSQLASSRVLIVGDVHGCLDELRALVSRVGQPCEVVLVGDLVNKGPDSAGVVRYARELGARCVRGNHDDAMLEAAYSVGRFQLGGRALPDRYGYVSKLSDADIAWTRELPLSITIDADPPIRVVHAGVVPGVPLREQSFGVLTKVRNLVLETGGDKARESLLPVEKGNLGRAWARVYSDRKNSGGLETSNLKTSNLKTSHVFFGHDARRGLQRLQHATGLDTGCCYGRSLSGALVEFKGREWTFRIVQEPARKTYVAVPGSVSTTFPTTSQAKKQPTLSRNPESKKQPVTTPNLPARGCCAVS